MVNNYPEIPETPTGDILDPEWYPELPETPDEAWDILGWLSYLLDIVIYIFRLVVFLIRSLVLGIGNIFSNVTGLLNEVGQTLSFLPAEITVLITLSLISLVVIKFMKRGS